MCVCVCVCVRACVCMCSFLTKGCVLQLFFFCAVGHVLEHFWTRFTEDVDAKAIAFSLKHEGIINDSAITTIQQSNDARSNGQYLHDYLMRTCDKESLVKVCDIIIAVQGNPKMKSLGKDMKDMLESKHRVHM